MFYSLRLVSFVINFSPKWKYFVTDESVTNLKVYLYIQGNILNERTFVDLLLFLIVKGFASFCTVQSNENVYFEYIYTTQQRKTYTFVQINRVSFVTYVTFLILRYLHNYISNPNSYLHRNISRPHLRLQLLLIVSERSSLNSRVSVYIDCLVVIYVSPMS